MSVFPTGVSTDADLSIAVNNLACTLNGAIDNVVTTVVVNSTAGFPTAGYITIDVEIIKYTSTSGTQFLGCTRGADGSANVSHSDLTTVYHNIVAAHHNALKDEVKAIEQNISDRIGLGSTDIIMTALRKLYLSATSYIVESSSNIISFVTGIYTELTIDGINHATVIRGSSKLNLDGSGGIGGNTYIIESTPDNMDIYAGGGKKLTCSGTATEDVTVNGVFKSTGDLYTEVWTDYSATSTIVGWSSLGTQSLFYKKIGKLVYVTFSLSGTSNSTAVTFTLPYACNSQGTSVICYSRDNTGTAVAGLASVSSSTVTVRPTVGTTTWTASGTKAVEGQFWYQTA